MEPQAKRSRSYNSTHAQPFPALNSVQSSGQDHFECTGYFTGTGVEIFEPQAISRIHKNGCFGSHHSNLDGEGTLVLFPEEAFFLQHSLRCLRVLDLNEQVIGDAELWEVFVRQRPRFVELYVAFLYLRSKNWVVKCGLKFGGDFLLYKEGPRFYHGSYVVLVRTPSLQTVDLQGHHRIAEASKKELLLIEVSQPKMNLNPSPSRIECLINLHLFTASEVNPKRFNIHQER